MSEEDGTWGASDSIEWLTPEGPQTTVEPLHEEPVPALKPEEPEDTTPFPYNYAMEGASGDQCYLPGQPQQHGQQSSHNMFAPYIPNNYSNGGNMINQAGAIPSPFQYNPVEPYPQYTAPLPIQNQQFNYSLWAQQGYAAYTPHGLLNAVQEANMPTLLRLPSYMIPQVRERPQSQNQQGKRHRCAICLEVTEKFTMITSENVARSFDDFFDCSIAPKFRQKRQCMYICRDHRDKMNAEAEKTKKMRSNYKKQGPEMVCDICHKATIYYRQLRKKQTAKIYDTFFGTKLVEKITEDGKGSVVTVCRVHRTEIRKRASSASDQTDTPSKDVLSSLAKEYGMDEQTDVDVEEASKIMEIAKNLRQEAEEAERSFASASSDSKHYFVSQVPYASQIDPFATKSEDSVSGDVDESIPDGDEVI